jgi:hypothetical protein
MKDNEIDCMNEIKAFVQFGDYALELLPKVIDNIWLFYNIHSNKTKTKILSKLEILDLLGVETKIS